MTDIQSADVKTCPDCAEDVKIAARVCRFCGYRFDRDGSTSEHAAAAATGAETADAVEATPGATPRDWRHLLLLAASGLIWLLTIPPLATALKEDESTEDLILSYLAAIIFSLAVAVAIRFTYTHLRKRPFMFTSPWLFVIATVISLLSVLGGQSE